MALSDNTRRNDPWENWGGVSREEVLSASLLVTARCFERGHLPCQQGCRTSPVHLVSEGLLTSAAEGVPTPRFTQLLATVGGLHRPTVQNCLRGARTGLSGEQIELFIKAVERRKAENVRRSARDSSSDARDDTSGSSRATGERATEGDAAGRHLLEEVALEGLGDQGEAAGRRGAGEAPAHLTGPTPTTDWAGLLDDLGERLPEPAPEGASLAGRLRVARQMTAHGDEMARRVLQKAPAGDAQNGAGRNGRTEADEQGLETAEDEHGNQENDGASNHGAEGTENGEDDGADENADENANGGNNNGQDAPEPPGEDDPGATEEQVLAARKRRRLEEAEERRMMSQALTLLAQQAASMNMLKARSTADQRDAANILRLQAEDTRRGMQIMESQAAMQQRSIEIGKAGAGFGWKFSGRPVPNNQQHATLQEFLRQLEAYAAVRGITDQGKVELCRCNLSGDAQQWFVAQSYLEAGRSMAFISDWELTKRHLVEQYSRVGACYYLDMRSLFVQQVTEDAEQFYSRVMLTLEEFLDQHGDTLYDWAFPKRHGLLMPGVDPALDGGCFNQFENPMLEEGPALAQMIREVAQRGTVVGVENRLEYAIAAYSQAYLQEFLRQSQPQYKTYYKESHAWFQMIDGLRNANTRRYAGNLVRAMLRKPKEQRISTRELWVRIKTQEMIESGATDRVVPAVPAAAVEIDTELPDTGLVSAASWKQKGRKSPYGGAKAFKHLGSGAGGGSKPKRPGKQGGGSGGKRARVAPAEGSESPESSPTSPKAKVCDFCGRPGHRQATCWRKHPEQRPEGWRDYGPPGSRAAGGVSSLGAGGPTEGQTNTIQFGGAEVPTGFRY